ncbi:MAG: hypothetical protein UHP28_00270 [Treponema sp.]|nr:hypothetical protein [Treponema sp.]
MSEEELSDEYERTSAAKTELGFEYQFYYFLNQLLQMKKGESISWEVEDDVCRKMKNGTEIFFQIKHTIQKNIDGTPVNLTNLDADLWKTLDLWVNIIKKSNAPNVFLKNKKFVLGSNKSIKENSLYSEIEKIRNKTIDINEIKNKIRKLKTKNSTIQEYINNCLTLSDDVLEEFFKTIEFNLGQEDIIQQCKDSIETKLIKKEKIDYVFNEIHSIIRTDLYDKLKNDKKGEITFEEFSLKTRRVFDKYRSGELSFFKEANKLPDKIEEQLFIKQLIDIDDLKINETDIILEYTKFKLFLENTLAKWLETGDITESEINDYYQTCITQWKNIFRKEYRNITDELSYKDIGRKILYALREKIFNFGNQSLDIELSNGTIYHLSDIPKIGFINNWEEKYGK